MASGAENLGRNAAGEGVLVSQASCAVAAEEEGRGEGGGQAGFGEQGEEDRREELGVDQDCHRVRKLCDGDGAFLLVPPCRGSC